MRKISRFLATLAVSALFSSLVMAEPALDAADKCRDNGKFVSAVMCKTSAHAAIKCRDIKTKKFAKCSAKGTEPVPMSNA